VLPGIIGVIQANEALKILVGYGEPLIGRILTFDATTTTFGEYKLRKDPECATCSHPPRVVAGALALPVGASPNGSNGQGAALSQPEEVAARR
jgi:hypothetical protein